MKTHYLFISPAGARVLSDWRLSGTKFLGTIARVNDGGKDFDVRYDDGGWVAGILAPPLSPLEGIHVLHVGDGDGKCVFSTPWAPFANIAPPHPMTS